MTNACYEESGRLYGVINVRSADDYTAFGESRIAHLVELSDEERIDRWKKYWFPDVRIEYNGA